jgi:hypothetical protein
MFHYLVTCHDANLDRNVSCTSITECYSLYQRRWSRYNYNNRKFPENNASNSSIIRHGCRVRRRLHGPQPPIPIIDHGYKHDSTALLINCCCCRVWQRFARICRRLNGGGIVRTDGPGGRTFIVLGRRDLRMMPRPAGVSVNGFKNGDH